LYDLKYRNAAGKTLCKYCASSSVRELTFNGLVMAAHLRKQQAYFMNTIAILCKKLQQDFDVVFAVRQGDKDTPASDRVTDPAHPSTPAV